jgi:hypothetical protein
VLGVATGACYRTLRTREAEPATTTTAAARETSRGPPGGLPPHGYQPRWIGEIIATRGMSCPSTKAFLAGLVAVALVTGCGGGTKTQQLSVAQIVAKTTANTAQVKSFHFVLKVEHPGPSTSGLSLAYANGDVVVPDKLKADIAGTLSGVSLKSALVINGPSAFIKDPFSGKWQRVDVKTSPVAFFDPAKGVLAVIKSSIRVRLAGSATVGGVDCYSLEGKVPARALTAILGNAPSDRLADVELLVGKDDLVLRRIRLTSPIAASEPASIARQVDISKLDEKISIEAPHAG